MSDSSEQPTSVEGASPARLPKLPVVPDHELLRCIGRGGYGEVWLARNIMGTHRAIKIVQRAAFASDKPYEREFSGIHKFEPLSRTHEGLVDILQIGRNDTDGYFYYVMELADDAQSSTLGNAAQGEGARGLDVIHYIPRTLRADLRKSGAVDYDTCLCLALALSSAIGHLHENGLIHRDIKPSNIIFVNGLPKLADIGLVAHMDEARSFVGTEGYIPPEGPGTVQSDIYSLGKVLEESAFGSDRESQDKSTTATAATPTSGAASRLGELGTVIERACAPEIAKRYQTAAALNADVLLLQSGRSVRQLHKLERRLKVAARFGAMAAVVLAIATAAYFYEQRHADRLADLAAVNARAAAENLRIAAQSQERLASQYVTKAAEYMDRGDYGGALLWNVHALKLVAGNAAKELPHRIRIGVLLRETPELVQTIFADKPVSEVRFVGDEILIGTRAGGANFDGPIPMKPVLWNWRSAVPSPSPLPDLLAGKIVVNDRRLTGLTITNLDDQSVRIRDLRTGQILSPPFGDLLDNFNDMGGLDWTYAASGSIAVGVQETEFAIWDLAAKKPLREDFLGYSIYAVAVAPDANRVAFGGADGRITIFSITYGPTNAGPPAPAVEFENPLRRTVNDRVVALQFSPGGNRLIIETSASLQSWTLAEDRLVEIKIESPSAIRFGADEDLIAVGAQTGFAAVWDRATGMRLTPFLRHRGLVRALDFSPQGQFLATASDDAAVRIWNLSNPGQARRRLKTNADAAPLGFKLDAGGSETPETMDSVKRIWFQSKSLVVHDAGVRDVQVFHPDRADEPISSPFGLSGKIERVALDRGEEWLALATAHTARVWDWRRGQPLTPELNFRGDIVGLDLGSQKNALFVQLRDGGGEILDLSPSMIPMEQLLQTAELYAGEKIDPNVGVTGLTREETQRRWTAASARVSVPAALDSALAWHQGEAAECEARGLFAAALVHLQALALAKPNDPDLLTRRGWALAEESRFADAAADFIKASEAGARPEEILPLAALALLRADQPREFSNLAQAMLTASRNGQLNEAETALAIWTVFLSPQSTNSADPWLQTARGLSKRLPDDARAAAALALAELRVGDPKIAFILGEKWWKSFSVSEQASWICLQALAAIKSGDHAGALEKAEYLRVIRDSPISWEHESELRILTSQLNQAMPEAEFDPL